SGRQSYQYAPSRLKRTDAPLGGSERRERGGCVHLYLDAVEPGRQQRVVARLVEQEGVVASRAVDLGIADVALVVQQRVGDLARTLGREAPVGGEGHHQEVGAGARQRGGQVAAVFEGGVEVVERLGGQQVG